MGESFKYDFFKLIYLQLTTVSPIIITCVCLLNYGYFTLTIFIYNFVTMILLPAIYLFIIEKDQQKRKLSYYFRNRLEDPKRQVLIGLILFTITFGLIMVNYDICQYYFKKEVIEKIHINLDKNFLNFSLLVMFLGTINPFLEEWFWRNFIPQAIFDILYHDYNNNLEDQNQNSYQLDSLQNQSQGVYISQFNQQLQKGQTLNKKKYKYLNEELFQIIISMLYASYHFFVVYYMTNALYATIAVIVISVAGRIFLFINNEVGYIANGIYHMGADIGFCALALIILYNNRVL